MRKLNSQSKRQSPVNERKREGLIILLQTVNIILKAIDLIY